MNNLVSENLIMTISMIVAASLVGLITGYTIPLISIELSKNSVDPLTIGAIAALPAIGMMLSCFVTPKLSCVFSISRLVSFSLIALVLSTVVSCMTFDVYILIIPRLLTGFFSGVLVVLGESWITGNASTHHRAALTGLYTSTFTGCQLLGPLILTGGYVFQFPTLIGICFIAFICIILLHRTKVSLTTESSYTTGWRDLSGLLPILASGVFCFSFFDASILSLFPLYGVEQGLKEQYAISLVTIILVGDALFQVPIGYIADHIGTRKVHIFSGLIFCVMIMIFPTLFFSLPLLIIGCLILGAFAGALYTLSLVRAGKILAGQKLIIMNAILGLVWSAGSISGPIISGGSIFLAGYNGMIGVILITGLFFIVIQLMSPSRSQDGNRISKEAKSRTAI
ncbi:MFS transporter [Vibrio cholerae]|uniref:MFS transporter n=1 Tax=Vibrio cholerae TaxID=666 RepID=UPI002DBD17F1|nr:MFS transporter [Vibrio cholerae]EGR1116199.1 MFS transporter [Vibrio cholerae]MEB5539708.1 MFS transporter [Vibrio cholerae]MEB5548476.1 MFS transporter [Vibrio cholerae]